MFVVTSVQVLYVCFFALMMVITGCSGHNSDADIHSNSLKIMIKEVIEQHKAPGAAMSIKFSDGSVMHYAEGFADKEEQTPLTPEHLFRIGSASKTITATAILLLVQRDQLSLDASVESILPGRIPDYGDQITVRMLLNHTSGLEDYVASPYEGSYFFPVLYNNPERSWEPEALVTIALDEGLASPPGEMFNYSNTNYILLGLIIESVSGQPVEDYIKINIFDTLGLNKTIMPLTTGFQGKFAHGYFEKAGDGVLYDYSIQSPSAVWAAGNIISTPSDLLIWLEALTSGTLLNQEIFLQQLETISMGESVEDGYGLGVFKSGGDIGHNGSVLGYQIQMFSSKNTLIVIYSNCYYLTRDNISKIIFEKTKEIIL